MAKALLASPLQPSEHKEKRPGMVPSRLISTLTGARTKR